MKENKIKSWRDGIVFAMSCLLIICGILYYSYITYLMIMMGIKEFTTSFIVPTIEIVCYIVFGILAFVFIGKGKCPKVFLALGLLVEPFGRIVSEIRSFVNFDVTLLTGIVDSISLLVSILVFIFVIFALFNLAGKRKLWSILASSIFIALNLYTLLNNMELNLGVDYVSTFIFPILLVAYGVLYLLISIKSEGCSCGKCECKADNKTK